MSGLVVANRDQKMELKELCLDELLDLESSAGPGSGSRRHIKDKPTGFLFYFFLSGYFPASVETRPP